MHVDERQDKPDSAPHKRHAHHPRRHRLQPRSQHRLPSSPPARSFAPPPAAECRIAGRSMSLHHSKALRVPLVLPASCARAELACPSLLARACLPCIEEQRGRGAEEQRSRGAGAEEQEQDRDAAQARGSPRALSFAFKLQSVPALCCALPHTPLSHASCAPTAGKHAGARGYLRAVVCMRRNSACAGQVSDIRERWCALVRVRVVADVRRCWEMSFHDSCAHANGCGRRLPCGGGFPCR